MAKISSKKIRRAKEQTRFQKEMLKKVEKGKVGALDAEKMLKSKGFALSSSFNEKLVESQKKFLMSRPLFVKKLREFEEEKKEKEKFEEEKPRLQLEGFKSAFKLMKRRELTVDEFSCYVNELEKKGFRSEIKDNKGKAVKWNEVGDGKRFSVNKKFFDETRKLLQNNKISPQEAVKIGKALGLHDAYKWWERYYQEQPRKSRNFLKKILRK